MSAIRILINYNEQFVSNRKYNLNRIKFLVPPSHSLILSLSLSGIE